MQVVDVHADLRMLVGSPGQAYLFRRDGEMTLVDALGAGHAPDIADAIEDWGEDPMTLRRLVLTHWHADHAGSASAVGHWPGIEVLAHRADAPVIRGEVPGPPADLTEAEGVLHAQVAADLPAAGPARVDTELRDGDIIESLRARVIGLPGHTAGSIALWLPVEALLFTGDTAANSSGQVVLGPFNTDRAQAVRSFRRFADLPARLVCFGHGQPLEGPAAAALADAARAEQVPDPFG